MGLGQHRSQASRCVVGQSARTLSEQQDVWRSGQDVRLVHGRTRRLEPGPNLILLPLSHAVPVDAPRCNFLLHLWVSAGRPSKCAAELPPEGDSATRFHGAGKEHCTADLLEYSVRKIAYTSESPTLVTMVCHRLYGIGVHTLHRHLRGAIFTIPEVPRHPWKCL